MFIGERFSFIITVKVLLLGFTNKIVTLSLFPHGGGATILLAKSPSFSPCVCYTMFVKNTILPFHSLATTATPS